jgi:hypothetical protein
MEVSSSVKQIAGGKLKKVSKFLLTIPVRKITEKLIGTRKELSVFNFHLRQFPVEPNGKRSC